MATRSPLYCRLCNETPAPSSGMEHHLVSDHDQRELARRLVAEWESEELDDPA